ncbi:hypothetical protein P8Q88_09550 [Qipengyuania sp. XHP0207]|uniref:hypothetical protein n=1 Tax=Qipengyuania sp. XHP0207 TaxID=3038078 RepID=UPI00241DCB9A|nr:hypothetical protein [Qipengyuania sp. XHP0207]MDG5748427.1 hypothetical protein [Qipengyuania sp. XHP0207]
MAVLVVPVVACQSAPSSPHLITIARPAFAGEALFRGELEVVRGCVVVKGDRRSSAVLFDPGVTLLPSGDGLHDPHSGNDISFGQRISGGGGFLRENAKGWPISDIERFYGVTIPAACPKDDIMRLRNMEVLEG